MKQNYITTLLSIISFFSRWIKFSPRNKAINEVKLVLHITGWPVLLHTVTYSYIPYVIAIDNKDNNWWYVTSYCDKTGKSDKSVNTSSSIYELSVNVLTGNIKFWKQTSNLKNNIKFWKHHDHNRKLCHALWWLEDSHWCNMHTFVIGNWFFLW